MVRSHGRRAGGLEDDSSVKELDVTKDFRTATASEGDTVTVPNNPDVIPVYADTSTGEILVPDL